MTVPAQEGAMPTEVTAHITGTVWKIQKQTGESVAEGEAVVILESMKMEMPVEAPEGGVVKEIRCKETQSVNEGDVLVVLG
jgi:acetyl-CoA carboxylase biotin carboxyl carrier protein